MASTLLGTQVNTPPGATTSFTQDSVTHTIIREMPAVYARRPVTQHPSYQAVVVVNDYALPHTATGITYEAGDMATVTYTYGGGSGAGSGDGGGSSSGGGSPSNTPGTTYDLDVATEAVSILRHKRYRNVSGSERLILGRMLQQGPTDDDGNDLSSTLQGTAAIECADKIKAGIVSFEAPVYVWRETISGGTWSVPAGIGKISAPSGPYPSVGGGNWLFVGVQSHGGDNIPTTVTSTWKSSIYQDTWDSNLYS